MLDLNTVVLSCCFRNPDHQNKIMSVGMASTFWSRNIALCASKNNTCFRLSKSVQNMKHFFLYFAFIAVSAMETAK